MDSFYKFSFKTFASITLLFSLGAIAQEIEEVIVTGSKIKKVDILKLDIEGAEIIVHALTQELMDGLTEGDMDQRVNYLEKS